MAGYLVWSDRIANQPQAVALVEHVVGHAMGEPGRELLSELEGMPAARPGAVSDRIEIRDLRVTGTHGVLPEERDGPSPSRSTWWPGSTRRRPSTATTWPTPSTTAPWPRRRPTWSGRPLLPLLEALAGRLASALLIIDPRLEAVEVTVRKLRPPLALDVGSTGVRVRRAR